MGRRSGVTHSDADLKKLAGEELRAELDLTRIRLGARRALRSRTNGVSAFVGVKRPLRGGPNRKRPFPDVRISVIS